MRLPATDGVPPPPAPDPAGDRPLYGYRRLRFFDVRVWQVAGLVVLLVTLAFYLMPRQRVLVSFFTARGMHAEAEAVVARMLAETPDDPDLLLVKAAIHERQGRPDQVLAALEYLVARHPGHAEGLERLAVQYEWNRRPRQALTYWRRLAGVAPTHIAAQRRVIELLRHFGLTVEEARAVFRLVNLEKRLPADVVYADLGEGARAGRLARDPFHRSLNRALRRLARPDPAAADPLFRDEALRELFAVRQRYRRLLADGDEPPPELRRALRVRAFEIFAQNGLPAAGRRLAADLDRLTGEGTGHRLLMADVLRWNGLPEEADRLLAALFREHPGDAAVLAAAAAAARARGDTAAAGEILLRAAEQEGGAPELLGGALSEAAFGGHRDLVQRVIDAFRRRHPGDEALQADLAERLVAAGDLHGAIDLLAELHRRRPGDRLLAARLAELYGWTAQPEAAYEVYAALVGAVGGERAAVARMLDLAAATGRPGVVRRAVAATRRLRPADRELAVAGAEHLIGAGALAEAADLYLALYRQAPSEREVRRRLATLYEWTGRPAAAYRLLARHLEDGREETADIERLLALAAASGEPALIREAAGLARRRGPAEAAWRLKTARTLRDAGALADAVALFEAYLEERPGDVAARRELAEVHGWIGAPRAAAETLAALSDTRPADAGAALAAAEAWLLADDPPAAARYLERAAAGRPRDAGLKSRLAEIYGWLGRGADQIRVLEGLAAQGRLTQAQGLVLARAYLARGSGANALPYLASVADRRPLPMEEALLLVDAYTQAGRTDAALGILERLAAENRHDADRLAALGQRALWLDRTAAAGRFFEMALARDPRHLTALKGSAQVLAWNNDAQRAMRRFERYNRLAPDDYEARYQLGELYLADGRPGAAHRQYRKTLRLIERARRLVSPPASP